MTPLEIVRKIRAIKVRNVCVNCGYEEGVHHYETLQCPGDDPNSMKGGRLWKGTTYQTRATPLLTESEAAALLTDDIETQTECYNVECPKHTKTEPIGICQEGDCEKVSAWSDEPSKAAEELVQQIWDECVTSPGAYVEFDNYGAAKLIQSALDAHAKAKVEEAADRFCTICPERDVADDGTFICESDWNGVCCPKLAAILGREDAHKGEEGRG